MTTSISLTVRDLDATERFYSLGLHLPIQRLVPEPGYHPLLLLTHAGITIVFRDIQTVQHQHPALYDHLDRHPFGTGVRIELSLPDIEFIRRELERGQWHILYELEDDEHKWREIWVNDPDGYLLVLSSETGDEP